MSSTRQEPIRTVLPTPRAFLTSLLTTSSVPPPTNQTTSPEDQPINPPYDSPCNPFKTIPPTYRALLTTLHVLFPQPMLLHALDLLDRGLVMRLVERVPPPNLEEKESGSGVMAVPLQVGAYLLESQDEMARVGKGGKKNIVYQVRSSQAPKGRFKDPGGSTGRTLVYTVRLQAWNCSCAAFAFAAFPGGSRAQASWSQGDGSDEEGEGKDRKEWEFGGLSFDDNVPVCKHLLACLLSERWGNILGRYVKERLVGRHEMAGVGGEG